MQYENVKATHLGAFSIYFLWLACVFDPVGRFFAFKFISIGLVFVYSAARFALSGLPKVIDNSFLLVLSLFCFILPIYGLTLSAFNGGINDDVFIDTSYISSAVYIACALLYIIPVYYHVACRALVFSLSCLCFVIWSGFFLLLLDCDFGFLDFFVANGTAYIGRRNYGGVFFYYIYFVASPMLIFLLCKQCWDYYNEKTFSRFAIVLCVMGALFLSGTRASIIVSIVTPLVVWLWTKYGVRSILIWLFILIMCVPALGLLDLALVSHMFSSGEESNSMKIAYLSTYLHLFAQPETFWFGQGFNAHTWSEPVFNMLPEGASKTELTYFEMLRVFGVLGLAAFACVVFNLTSSTKVVCSHYPWVAPAVFLYALVSFINPYIFSSNGMLVIGFAAGACLHIKCQEIKGVT